MILNEGRMETKNDRLTIRDYPFLLWLIGLLALGFAVMAFIQKPTQLIGPVIGGFIFLMVFLTSSVMTVTADRTTSLLTVKHSSPLRCKVIEVPISDITAVELERSTSTTSGNYSSSYRIAFTTRDNQTIPLHSYYSNGSVSMQSRATRLREFLGVGGLDISTGGIIKQGIQMAQQHFQEQQEALTGSQDEEHITNGIHWKIQTVTMGASPVSRWFSPDFHCASCFVFLAQKVVGQKTVTGGLGKILFQTTVGLYGFSAEDTPDLASANVLSPIDATLDSHFSALTSDNAAAQKILNPSSISLLIDWGTRYPLKQVQKAGLFGQLVVMFSPRGLFVASLGTMIPEALDEMTNLGIALIKAQGS
jgi:hypothetical protein